MNEGRNRKKERKRKGEKKEDRARNRRENGIQKGNSKASKMEEDEREKERKRHTLFTTLGIISRKSWSVKWCMCSGCFSGKVNAVICSCVRMSCGILGAESWGELRHNSVMTSVTWIYSRCWRWISRSQTPKKKRKKMIPIIAKRTSFCVLRRVWPKRKVSSEVMAMRSQQNAKIDDGTARAGLSEWNRAQKARGMEGKRWRELINREYSKYKKEGSSLKNFPKNSLPVIVKVSLRTCLFFFGFVLSFALFARVFFLIQ